MKVCNKAVELAIEGGYVITDRIHQGPRGTMNDWGYGRPGCSNWWHPKRLYKNWLQQSRRTHQDVEINGDSTRVDQPGLLEGLHLHGYPQKEMHVCRIQEGYIWHYRGIIAILDPILQNSIRNGLSEKWIWLVCHEKIVNDKQWTILWHNDDLNMSDVDPDIVSSVLSDIDAEYGKISKLTITRSKIQKYLRITIE